MQAFALAWLAAVAQLSAGIPVAHGKEGETPACNKTAKNGISLHECIYGTDDTANGAPTLRVDGRDEKAQRAFLSSYGCCINATTLCHLLPRASPSTSWKEERMLSPTNDRMCVLAIENTETFEAPGLVQSEDGDALLTLPVVHRYWLLPAFSVVFLWRICVGQRTCERKLPKLLCFWWMCK